MSLSRRAFLRALAADEALAWLRDRPQGRPFFLYFAPTAPHLPLQAPPDAIAAHKGRYDAGYAAVRDARLAKQKALGLIPPRHPPAAPPRPLAERQAQSLRGPLHGGLRRPGRRA